MIARAALLALALLVAGCGEEEAAPPPGPAAMTEDAVGRYCQMTVLEHGGPKAQIHVKGLPDPLWFPQVRDAIAFLRMPEETAEVRAVYVSDMGRAASWDDPGAENWIDARKAFFVIGAAVQGGMGAPEAVPFADRAAAEAWRAEHGGRIVALDEIPDDYVLAPVDVAKMLGSSEETQE